MREETRGYEFEEPPSRICDTTPLPVKTEVGLLTQTEPQYTKTEKIPYLEPIISDDIFAPVPQKKTSQNSALRKRCFPFSTEVQWKEWQWQLKNRICDLAGMQRLFRLSENELGAFTSSNGVMPVSITPYYALLLHQLGESHPLRKAVVPTAAELVISDGEAEDPLGENDQSPVRGLVHRYPDRVLFLVTHMCSSYCRYCTRSRLVGKADDAHAFSKQSWQKCIQYIEEHTEVRDVLVSGGDPLMLQDESIEWLLGRLRRIEHVEIIRIGTKAPVVLPQRITYSLLKILKRYHPLFLSIHFTHPDELTPEVSDACNKLADAGIPLGSQTVLLAGINDSTETMKKLFHGLLRIRVRPYYLYQCDPILGSAHFRTPVSKGIEIIQSLRGHTTGYAIPQFVIDAPGGGGKIPVAPDYVIAQEKREVVMKSYNGNTYRYPDTIECRP